MSINQNANRDQHSYCPLGNNISLTNDQGKNIKEDRLKKIFGFIVCIEGRRKKERVMNGSDKWMKERSGIKSCPGWDGNNVTL